MNEFNSLRYAGKLAEYCEVYPDCWYGKLKSDLDSALDTGLTPVMIMDIEGVEQFKKTSSDSFNIEVVFVDSSIETLKDRMLKERSELPETEIAKRVNRFSVEKQYANTHECYRVDTSSKYSFDVVNKQFMFCINSITNQITD